MELSAPSLTCPNCRGTGAWVRSLKLIVNGNPAEASSKVILHCSCLSEELRVLHARLTDTGIFKDWPWDELKNLSTPQAEGGPTPVKIGMPFSINSKSGLKLYTPERPAQEPTPKKAEVSAPKPRLRRGRSKMG